MRVELGDDVREVPLRTSERPLLERAWVKANIDRLTAMLADGTAATDAAKGDLRRQILELSTKYRVLSDYTALLVLETEFDYQRFGIDRKALAEILTVGPQGITTIDRTRLPDKGAIARDDRPIDPPATREPGLLDGLFDGDRKRNEGGSPAPAAATEARHAEAAPTSADRERSAAPTDGRSFEAAGGAPPPPPAEPIAVADVPMPDAVMAEETAAPSKAKRAPASRRFVDDDMEMRRPPRPPVAPIQPNYAPTPRPPEYPKPTDAYEGRFGGVMQKVAAGDRGGALREAWSWREQNPGDELALLALGEAAEAAGDLTLAARAYGSLIDLFPGRADLRRMAGERLEALGPAGLALAIDTFAQAVLQRPDHPSSHRLHAFALLKAGRHAEAFAAALAGARQQYPWGRFAGVTRILDEDLRLIAAAWLAERPKDEATIRAELARAGVTPDTAPSLRFVLNWETDANDVDFHIYDGKGGHAYYSNRSLPSGGELYADVTTGYGPECFTVPGVAAAYPYTLQGHYYSRGPMGYGMGKLEVIEHDGAGHLQFKEHPFVIMKDSAYVGLGRLDAPLAASPAGARLPTGTAGQAPGSAPYTPPPPVPAPLPPQRF
jgi:hypothetical protein